MLRHGKGLQDQAEGQDICTGTLEASGARTDLPGSGLRRPARTTRYDMTILPAWLVPNH